MAHEHHGDRGKRAQLARIDRNNKVLKSRTKALGELTHFIFFGENRILIIKYKGDIISLLKHILSSDHVVAC